MVRHYHFKFASVLNKKLLTYGQSSFLTYADILIEDIETVYNAFIIYGWIVNTASV